MIADVEKVFDDTIALPAPGRGEWWWCDSLYMVPPVLVRMYAATGDGKYLKLLDDLFWDTHEFLYDKQENLFYRDKNFFDRRIEGKKVVCVVSGGNIDAGKLITILGGGIP